MNHNERKSLTKIAIENAGIDCFSKKAFASVTMDEIARSANLSKRTIYNHYPSKATLIASIFESKLEELYNLELRSMQSCTNASEVLQTLFSTLNRFTLENINFMKMFWSLGDEINLEEVAQEEMFRIKRWNQRLVEMPAGFIRKMQLTGILAKFSPELIVHYVSAINKGLVLQNNKSKNLDLIGFNLQELTELSQLVFINSM